MCEKHTSKQAVQAGKIATDAVISLAPSKAAAQRLLSHPNLSPRLKALFAELSADNEVITVGGRTYDMLSFLRGDEKSVVGHTMVDRAKEMSAHQGKEDFDHLLKHQSDIPVALRGKVVFVFTDYCHPDCSGSAYYVYWDGDRWVQYWYWLGYDWYDDCRVLRRK